MHNVCDYGAVGDGVVDDTNSIQTAINSCIDDGGGEVFFPSVTQHPHCYKLTAPLVFSHAAGAHKQVYLVGEGGIDLYGSIIRGDFPDYLIKHPNGASQVLRGLFGLSLQNTNPEGSGVLLDDSQQAVIERCAISAYKIGICVTENAYCTEIRNCNIVANGWPGGSVGILGGQVTIDTASIVGWEEGIRAYNVGFIVRGSRLEVNKKGIVLGRNQYNVNSNLAGACILGCSFERNDTAIIAHAISGCLISGNAITGTVNTDDTGQCAYGLRIKSASGLHVAGNTVSGTYSEAGIADESGYSDSSVYDGNKVNNFGSGTNWRVLYPIGKRFVGCNELVQVTTKVGTTVLDASCHRRMNMSSVSAHTLKVRADTYFNGTGGTPPIGWEYTITQLGIGQTTIAADPVSGPVNIHSYNGRNRLAGRYAVATLRKVANSEWVLDGKLTV